MNPRLVRASLSRARSGGRALLLLVALVSGPALPGLLPGQAPVLSRPLPPPLVPSVYALPGNGSLPYDSLRAGMLVRLSARGFMHRRMALIESRFDDTLLVRGVTERELLRVPAARIDWIEVSTGRRPSGAGLVTGGVIGLVAGVGVAVLLQQVADRDGQGPGTCPAITGALDCGLSPQLLVPSAALGAVVGMTVAARRPGDRWRAIELPPD